jgi:hypothetical protein
MSSGSKFTRYVIYTVTVILFLALANSVTLASEGENLVGYVRNLVKTVKVSENTTLHIDQPIPEALPEDSTDVILQRLTPEAQEFFKKSLAVRAGYEEGDNYKVFTHAYLMDENGYIGITPKSPYRPNPELYKDLPSDVPQYFYRYVKDCASDVTLERQLIKTSMGYENYVGANRKQQQCYDDGSLDTYYLESNERLE